MRIELSHLLSQLQQSLKPPVLPQNAETVLEALHGPPPSFFMPEPPYPYSLSSLSLVQQVAYEAYLPKTEEEVEEFEAWLKAKGYDIRGIPTGLIAITQLQWLREWRKERGDNTPEEVQRITELIRRIYEELEKAPRPTLTSASPNPFGMYIYIEVEGEEAESIAKRIAEKWGAQLQLFQKDDERSIYLLEFKILDPRMLLKIAQAIRQQEKIEAAVIYTGATAPGFVSILPIIHPPDENTVPSLPPSPPPTRIDIRA